MRLAEGDTLDDALELFHNHNWRAYKPNISAEQMAELIPVLAPLWQQSRQKVRVERPTQKVQNRPTPKVDKGSQSLGRKLVYARAGGLCEAGCGGRGQEWHHRKARSLGGTWHASNGMHLCRQCHAWVGEHAIEAGGKGWYLGARENPSATPMLRLGVWVVLADDGSFEPYEVGGAA